MIKILFVAYSGFPNPNTGGSNKIIYEILKNLDYSKLKPTFFSYDAIIEYKSVDDLLIDQSPKSFGLRRSGKKLYEKVFLYRYLTTRPWYLKIHFKKRDRFFKKHLNYFNEFDLIHIHDSLAAYYFIGLKKPKKILTIHSKGAVANEILESSKSEYLSDTITEFISREQKVYQNMDIITFPSIAAKDLYFKDLHLIENKNVKVIYNGIDVDYINFIKPGQILSEYGIEKNRYDGLILNIAAHVKPKNIDILIKTVAYIKENYKKNYLLINAGTGYLTPELRKLSEELKVAALVKFLGQIVNEKVIRLMKACDFFIMPSRKVIFDMVILEALASGITVIASDDGGNKEIITDGENGYLLYGISAKSIADIVLSNPPLKPLKQNALKTIKDMVKNYLNIYISLNISDDY